MEKTSDIATAAQEDALRHNQSQRLKDMAEALLQAYEALDPPKDHAGVDRAAKALMSLNKLMRMLYDEKLSMAKAAFKQRYTVMGKPMEPEPPTEAEQAQALAEMQQAVKRRIERLVEKRNALRAAEESAQRPRSG